MAEILCKGLDAKLLLKDVPGTPRTTGIQHVDTPRENRERQAQQIIVLSVVREGLCT